MINIIDTFRNVAGDKYAFIKMGILTVPVVISVYTTLSNNMILSSLSYIIFGVILVAVFFETIRRSCIAEPMLLPSFLNPIPMFFNLFKTILAAIPVTIICLCIYNYAILELTKYSGFKEDVSVYWIISIIIYLLLFSLFFASVTQYLDSGKIYDSYNPIKVVKALKTFILNIAVYFVQSIILNFFILVIPAMILHVMFGPLNFLSIFFCSMMAVINYFIIADYIGQTKKESESIY